MLGVATALTIGLWPQHQAPAGPPVLIDGASRIVTTADGCDTDLALTEAIARLGKQGSRDCAVSPERR